MNKSGTLIRWRIGCITLLSIFIFAAAADYFLYPKMLSPGPPPPAETADGLWMRYKWYFGEYNPELLPDRLKKKHISYAYFHVRFVKRNGELKFKYPAQARRLTNVVHRDLPGMKAVAWVFVANNSRFGEVVDLSKPAVRRRMVSEAVWLTTEAGFDGVQWDYEVSRDGDEDFLKLLKETKEAIPKEKLLSVAAPMWMPGTAGVAAGWSERYFERVAGVADQIVVMCYDSGMVYPRAYVRLLREQVARVTAAAGRGNRRCRVQFGLPTYFKGGPSHNPRAESLALGLKAVRRGFADKRTNKAVFEGVAIFADYTTDKSEWETYGDLWAQPRSR